MLGIIAGGLLQGAWPTIMQLLLAHLPATEIETLEWLLTIAQVSWTVILLIYLRTFKEDYKHIPKTRQGRIDELEQRIANLRKLLK